MDRTEQNAFSFLYDGVPFAELPKTVAEHPDGDGWVRDYRLEDGLHITHVLTRYAEFGAWEWVTWFSHEGTRDSGRLTELLDADILLPLEKDERPPKGFLPPDGTARLCYSRGAADYRQGFRVEAQPMLPGDRYTFSPQGGRSSTEYLPFFDLCRGDRGYIAAVGWTGQWHCSFSRGEEGVRLRAGIVGAEFYLHPGERIRTASLLLLPYENGQEEAHNRLRRLLRQNFCPLGQPGRPTEIPLSHVFWGGLSSRRMLDNLHRFREQELGFECMWIDAGWYGSSPYGCPDEHDYGWSQNTGEWCVNRASHPDGLLEVRRAAGEAGMRFLLWMEPERCVESAAPVQQHPDWFISGRDLGFDIHCLLDLGNDEARQYAIETVSGLIESLHIDIYRQDSNLDWLPFWNKKDEEGRRGLTQIKHIMGLYAFWDALIERFPHLLIDNCAGGGNRLDMEMLRRSVPMWRSDYQCTFNHEPEVTQAQNAAIAWWLPYTGTGAGCLTGDDYRTRSAYAPGLTVNYWGYEAWADFDPSAAAWVRRTNAEYKRVRPYLSADYYPLTMPTAEDSGWAVSQYHRPENGDGVLLAFRRSRAVCDRARLRLHGLKPEMLYCFTDEDSGQQFVKSGRELAESGLSLEIAQPRTSRLLFYRPAENEEVNQ